MKSAEPDFIRLAHQGVTLNEVKGLAVRFFAALRMTLLKGYVVKCTNILNPDLVVVDLKIGKDRMDITLPVWSMVEVDEILRIERKP